MRGLATETNKPPDPWGTLKLDNSQEVSRDWYNTFCRWRRKPQLEVGREQRSQERGGHNMAYQVELTRWLPPSLASAAWSLEWAEWDKNTQPQQGSGTSLNLSTSLLLSTGVSKQQQRILSPNPEIRLANLLSKNTVRADSPHSKESSIQKHQKSSTERQKRQKTETRGRY